METRIDNPVANDTRANRFFRAAEFASLGLEMGLAVFIGWFAGQWLDRQLDTTPWLMIVCVLFGIGAAFKAVYRVHQQLMRDESRTAEAKD